jgi:hypothetical protein
MANGAFLDYPSPESVLRWWIAGNSVKVFFAKEAQQVFCFDN